MKLLQDVHLHNYLSTCCHDNQATVENMIPEGEKLGLKMMQKQLGE